MAQYSRHEITETTVRYSLTTPSNAAELDKMFAAALIEFKNWRNREPWDDEIDVNVADDNIIVSWVKS